MTPEEFSLHTTELTNSLYSQSLPDWHSWLDYLVTVTRASAAHLYEQVASDKRPLAQTKDRNVKHCHSLEQEWSVQGQAFTLTLSFSNEVDKQYAKRFLKVLHDHIQTCIEMAVTYSSMCGWCDIDQACDDALGITRIPLDNKGRLLEKNERIQALHKQGIVSIKDNQISLLSNQTWLEESLASQVASNSNAVLANDCLTTNSQQGSVCYYLTQHPQPDTPNEHSFTLYVHKQPEQPGRRFLQERYNLCQSESHIAYWFATGLTVESISDKTGYSTHTIYSYIKKLYSKLGINKQSRLAALLWPDSI